MFLWISSLTYPNLLATKGYVVGGGVAAAKLQVKMKIYIYSYNEVTKSL